MTRPIGRILGACRTSPLDPLGPTDPAGRQGALAVTFGLAVGLALAQTLPADLYTVDCRTPGSQFALDLRRHSTPRLTFNLTEGGSAWTATGWTVTLAWGWSADGSTMGTLTGTVAGASATFQPADTNALYEAIDGEGGWARVIVQTNLTRIVFAEGTIRIRVAPEIERAAL